MVPDLLSIFLHSCEIKSCSGLGGNEANLFLVSMSIYQFRLPYCGSVPLVTQTLNEYSASCMRKSCPIRSGTEPCGPWRSFLRDKSRVSDGIQACICVCSSSPFHWIYVCNILIFPTLFSFQSPIQLSVSFQLQSIVWWLSVAMRMRTNLTSFPSWAPTGNSTPCLMTFQNFKSIWRPISLVPHLLIRATMLHRKCQPP